MDVTLWLVCILVPLRPHFNSNAAITIIFNHATTLRPAGHSVQSALSQAFSKFHNLNVGCKIAQNFTAPPSNYSIQDFVDFIMGVFVSLLLLYHSKI